MAGGDHDPSWEFKRHWLEIRCIELQASVCGTINEIWAVRDLEEIPEPGELPREGEAFGEELSRLDRLVRRLSAAGACLQTVTEDSRRTDRDHVESEVALCLEQSRASMFEIRRVMNAHVRHVIGRI